MLQVSRTWLAKTPPRMGGFRRFASAAPTVRSRFVEEDIEQWLECAARQAWRPGRAQPSDAAEGLVARRLASASPRGRTDSGLYRRRRRRSRDTIRTWDSPTFRHWMMSPLTGCAPRRSHGLSSSVSCLRSGCDCISSSEQGDPQTMRYACTAELDDEAPRRSLDRRRGVPGRPRPRRATAIGSCSSRDKRGGYRAEVTIRGNIPFAQLARRLVDLTDAAALGEHPFPAEDW